MHIDTMHAFKHCITDSINENKLITYELIVTILLLIYMKPGCRGYQNAALLHWASGRTDSATPRCFHPPDSCTSASKRASSSWDPAAPDMTIHARELGWVTGPRCPILRLIMRQNRRPTRRSSSPRRQRPAPQTAPLHRPLRQTCQTPPLKAIVITTAQPDRTAGQNPTEVPRNAFGWHISRCYCSCGQMDQNLSYVTIVKVLDGVRSTNPSSITRIDCSKVYRSTKSLYKLILMIHLWNVTRCTCYSFCFCFTIMMIHSWKSDLFSELIELVHKAVWTIRSLFESQLTRWIDSFEQVLFRIIWSESKI